jgi:hypothetical protein
MGRPRLNSIWMEVEEKTFLSPRGPSRLKAILRELVIWSEASYGYVYASSQAHRRIVQMTPIGRLDQAYWLNFFGQPYVDLFGMERVKNAPLGAGTAAVIMKLSETLSSPMAFQYGR